MSPLWGETRENPIGDQPPFGGMGILGRQAEEETPVTSYRPKPP